MGMRRSITSVDAFCCGGGGQAPCTGAIPRLGALPDFCASLAVLTKRMTQVVATASDGGQYFAAAAAGRRAANDGARHPTATEIAVLHERVLIGYPRPSRR